MSALVHISAAIGASDSISNKGPRENTDSDPLVLACTLQYSIVVSMHRSEIDPGVIFSTLNLKKKVLNFDHCP